MIIMAIDHVRDFVHCGAMSGSPTNLATTTPALFMTRWVTHLCAPAFMLTAGLGFAGRDPRDRSVAVWRLPAEGGVPRPMMRFDDPTR